MCPRLNHAVYGVRSVPGTCSAKAAAVCRACQLASCGSSQTHNPMPFLFEPVDVAKQPPKLARGPVAATQSACVSNDAQADGTRPMTALSPPLEFIFSVSCFGDFLCLVVPPHAHAHACTRVLLKPCPALTLPRSITYTQGCRTSVGASSTSCRLATSGQTPLCYRPSGGAALRT